MTKEAIKELKKTVTQAKNKAEKKLGSKVYELSNEIFQAELKSCTYNHETGKSETTHPILKEVHARFNIWCKDILNWSDLAQMLRDGGYIEYANRLQGLYDAKINLAKEALDLESKYEAELDIFMGTNQAERLFKSFINGEKNNENIERLRRYASSLKEWKSPEIIDGKLFVNGKATDDNTMVGVIIGGGNKIHLMHAYVAKDFKTNEEFIALRNYTQWRRSGLCIVDIMENIPREVIAYFENK